jgi:hypothetical protein
VAVDKRLLIRSYVESRLGAPITALCKTEDNAIESAETFACIKYWTAVPYTRDSSLTTDLSGGEKSVLVSDLKNLFFTDPDLRSDAYFLGIMKYDLNDSMMFTSLGFNVFDRYLLGNNAGFAQSVFPTQDPRYSADRQMRFESTKKMFQGSLVYRHDPIEDKIVFITPSVLGVAVVWYGWGFCSTRTIEIMQYNHLTTFMKMVALEFVDIVLASRSAIQFTNADFIIKTEDLENKRDFLRSEVERDLAAIADAPIAWS